MQMLYASIFTAGIAIGIYGGIYLSYNYIPMCAECNCVTIKT